MAKTPSSMLPLGTLAPEFSLMDTVTGKFVRFSHKNDNIGTVIFFICNHCPYVKHVNPELVRISNDYIPKGIRFIAINANDVSHYPDDSPEKMRAIALELGYPFPYLFDETQEVAMAYQAKCTPDFYVFDKENCLVYRGQLDDSRLGNSIKVNGQSIRTTLDNLLANVPVNPDNQKPSLGCNIKWKPENIGC
ncbi:MAG TPA: thioredoxin family protein [Legionella sp.]|nr:thioredoxin family protein [Legionella sp.]